MGRFRFFSVACAFLVVFMISCKDDEVSPSTPDNEDNQYVNKWIEENMAFWYYWNDELPSLPDRNLAPDDFFESLLSPQDRFSWIQENYQDLLNSLSGI